MAFFEARIAAAALAALLLFVHPGASAQEQLGAVADAPAPIALDGAVWTTVGARVPALELPYADGRGELADLAALTRTSAPDGRPPLRTLLVVFAPWDASSRHVLPIWLELTREAVAAGQLQIVAIAIDQHADRAYHYGRWVGGRSLGLDVIVGRERGGEPEQPPLSGALLWDPFALSGVRDVPVITAVDEFGITRLVAVDPRRYQEQFVLEFLDADFSDDASIDSAARPFRRDVRGEGRDGEARLALARLMAAERGGPSLFLDSEGLARAALAPGALPELRFFEGVAFRMRADSLAHDPGDFQAALDAWRAALLARPDRALWRRRIQQWGPALDKPFAFYDWVAPASLELVARGERPITLTVPLTESEMLPRSTRIPGTGAAAESAPTVEVGGAALPAIEPNLVRVETAVVLNTAAAGPKVRTPMGSCRVHVGVHSTFAVRWAAPPVLWLDLPGGWLAEGRRFELAAHHGVPRVEFDLSTPPLVIGPPPSRDVGAAGTDAGADGPDEHGGEGDGGPPGFTPPPSEIPAHLVLSIKVGASEEVLERRFDFTLRIDLLAPRPPGGDGPSDATDHGGDGHGKR